MFGIAGLLLSVALLPAQVHVPDADGSTGPINAVPLGGRGPTGGFQNLRTQIRVPAAFLPAAGSVIRDLGFAGASDGSYLYARLEVRLAHLQGTDLGRDFAANLAGEVLVRGSDNARYAVRRDLFTSLGLSRGFVHDGRRDLVVDVIIQGAYFQGVQEGSHRSSTLTTVYATDYSIGQPKPGSGPFLAGAKLRLTLEGGSSITIVGSGCPKADGQPVVLGYSGSVARGAVLTIEALEADAGAPLALLLGTDDQRWGQLSLPFDLAALGAPACLLRTDIVVSLGGNADARGRASRALPIPADATLRGKPLLGQWLVHANRANPLQVVASALLKTTIE